MSARVRLQKLLSRAGLASRRGAEDLIRDGRVSVNGEVVTVLGTSVDPAADVVAVDGRTVVVAAAIWVALYKPIGFVTTRHDPQGRRTVYDLLPAEHRRLLHVGRLDTDSEGLLLLTNDGDGAHRLLHPRFGVERVYDVIVTGEPDARTLDRLLTGVQLSDGVARASRVKRLPATKEGRARLRIALREGRNREVRRMLDAAGHPVERLRRVAYGPIRLAGLKPGRWRVLTETERRLIGSPQSRDPN